MKLYEKMTLARKRFWASKSPEERSQIFSLRAKKQWTRKTKAEKQARSQLMFKAKQLKNATLNQK